MNSKVFLILFFLTILTIRTDAQSAIPLDFQAYPVFIELDNGATGSGFFIWIESGVYLITANHVIFNNNTLKSNLAKTLSYSVRDSLGKEINGEINLKKLNENGFIKNDINNDVVAIKVKEYQTVDLISDVDGAIFTSNSEKELALMNVTRSNMKMFDEVIIGNDIFMFGYPKSIGIQNYPQIDYKRPLIKKGIVAGKNINNKKIVLDCEAYYGNSGGIVIELDERWTTRNFKAIGVITEFIPFAELWENKTHGYQNIEISNSGYSLATPMDFVIELIDSFK